MAIPNTYIIGIQKAGTTTLHDWMAQHPEVYGPSEYKDFGFFIRFEQSELIEQLNKAFPNPANKPIVLHSHVNYIFNPAILKEIAEKAPDAKLIVSLRNPVDRCFSAYLYFKKMRRENRSPKDALIYKPEIIEKFTKDDYDLRYIEQGFYAAQLENCLKYFKKDQILLIDFNKIGSEPEATMIKVFDFLGIDPGVKLDLQQKNATGSGVKSNLIQDLIIKPGKLKKILIAVFLDWWFPFEKRRELKQKLIEKNTQQKISNKSNSEEIEPNEKLEIKNYLKEIFREDVQKLDEEWGTNYIDLWGFNQ